MLPALLLCLAIPADAQAAPTVQVDTPRYDTVDAHKALASALYTVNLEFAQVRWAALEGMRPCFLFAEGAPRPPLEAEQIAERLARGGATLVRVPQSEAYEAAERGLCDLVRVGFAEPAPRDDVGRTPQTDPSGEAQRQPRPRLSLPVPTLPEPQVLERVTPQTPAAEPAETVPRLELAIARDGRLTRLDPGAEALVEGPRQRLRVSVEADAPLVAVEIVGDFPGIRLDRADLGGRRAIRREVTVPSPPPGSRSRVVARAVDSARRSIETSVVLRAAEVAGPQILLRGLDGRRFAEGSRVTVTEETFAFAFVVQAEGYLRTLAVDGIPEPGSPFDAPEVQRRESTLEVRAPPPGGSRALIIAATDWQGKRDSFRLELVRPAPPDPQPPSDRSPPRIAFDENPLRTTAAQAVVRGQVTDPGGVAAVVRLDPEVPVDLEPDGRFALRVAMPDPTTRTVLGFRARDRAGNATTARLVLWRLPLCGPETEAVSDARLRRIQSALNALGYAAGTADGVLGRNTCRALEAFGATEDLPPDLPWAEWEALLTAALEARTPQPPDETRPPDEPRVEQPPREEPPQRPNRPPRIAVAESWTADAEGFVDLTGEALDDGRIARVEIRDGDRRLVAGAQIRQSFALEACERRVITITAWDDAGLSASRAVRLSAGHWLGDWVCRTGVAPAWVVGGPAGVAALLLVLAAWRILRPRPRRVPASVVHLVTDPDPQGAPLVVEGPRLALAFRVEQAAPSETWVEPEDGPEGVREAR